MRSVLGSVAALLLGVVAHAQEELGLGRMWTVDQPPLERFAREYDFRPDPSWFEVVQRASLRFDYGCSASFVSAHGLVLTNHHCVRAAMQKIDAERDLVLDGFVASTWADELPLPGLEVQQLAGIRDVTARIEDGVQATDSPEVARDKRKQNARRLIEEVEAQDPTLRAEVVDLWNGARHHLYQHRVFADVRLVMAPHLRVSNFGGDPDNFRFPRYSLDFAFCRAYADGAPADTSATHFEVGDGAREGQPVFLVGSPARTHRLVSTAQLEHLRDVRYPRLCERIDRRLQLLQDAIAEDPAREPRLRLVLLNLENGQKLYRGEFEALREPSLLTQKAKGEAILLERLRADPELARRFAGLFERLAEIAQDRRRVEAQLVFHSHAGFAPLQRALALVGRALTGDDAHLDSLARVRTLDDPALERSLFVDHLVTARKYLPPDDSYLEIVLSGEVPKVAVAKFADSRLVHGDAATALAAEPAEVVLASTDPALVLARRIFPVVDAARRANEALELREQDALAEYGRAVHAVWGSAVGSDATMTLRVGDGRVQGYAKDGNAVPWRTVMKGLFARSAEFDGKPPFDLPTVWRDAEPRLDPTTPVAFVSTCDAAGGSSGSAVIDEQGRLVGVLFDGNYESLGSEFLFRDVVQRSVCVDVRAILASLEHVYGARHLVRELRPQAKTGR